MSILNKTFIVNPSFQAPQNEQGVHVNAASQVNSPATTYTLPPLHDQAQSEERASVSTGLL